MAAELRTVSALTERIKHEVKTRVSVTSPEENKEGTLHDFTCKVPHVPHFTETGS